MLPNRKPPTSAPALVTNSRMSTLPIIPQPPLRIDISSRFGARLRELRRDRNWTQLQVATTFGIDRSFISDVERGRKSISLPMLEVVALGFNMTLAELLQGL